MFVFNAAVVVLLSAYLFRQVNVLNVYQAAVNMVVQCFGASHFITAELTAFKCFSEAGVQ